MNALLSALKSKTVWGAIIIQAAGIVATGHADPMAIAHAVGVVLTTAGARDVALKAAAAVGGPATPPAP